MRGQVSVVGSREREKERERELVARRVLKGER